MDMPRKKQTVDAQAAARGPLPELPRELIDHLVKGPMSPEQVQDLMLAFNKAIIERAMGAEMNLHLGYASGDTKPDGQSNERNGSTGKTVLTERGALRIDVPRDRDGSYEPILIPKHERRFRGFDERIIAMYGRGMSVREIQGFISEHYGTQVSPDFISSVTDEVMAEAAAWQNRPLDPMYPVVFFDALRVTQAAGRRAQADQHGDRRGGRCRTARGIRSQPLGPEVPQRRGRLASGVGARGAVPGLPARDPARDLHDQRH